MKKLLAILLLSIPLFASASDIPFMSDVEINGEIYFIGGTLKGVNVGPTGDYSIYIKGAKKFKGAVIKEMKCVAMPKLMDVDKSLSRNAVKFETAYYFGNDLMEYTVGGVISTDDGEPLHALPGDGYVVSILNGNSIKEWNSLKCRVK